MKRAFGIITALIIIILVSMILSFVVRLSTSISTHVTDTYKRERAELFMQSVIENSVLAIEGYKRDLNNKCLTNIHFRDEHSKFEANVTILRYYCYDINDCPCDTDLVKLIATDKSHGNVLLKILIQSKDKNVRLEKVTLQRM